MSLGINYLSRIKFPPLFLHIHRDTNPAALSSERVRMLRREGHPSKTLDVICVGIPARVAALVGGRTGSAAGRCRFVARPRLGYGSATARLRPRYVPADGDERCRQSTACAAQCWTLAASHVASAHTRALRCTLGYRADGETLHQQTQPARVGIPLMRENSRPDLH